MNVSTIEPKEIKFNSINEMSIDKLVAIAAVHQHPLYFCSGKLFSFEPYAQTEWQHKEVSQGNHFFYSLTYTEGENTYEEILSHESSGTKVPIVDLTQHLFWVNVFEQLNA